MQFDTRIAYLACDTSINTVDIIVFKCIDNDDLAMEIGTGELVSVRGLLFIPENTTLKVSEIFSSLLINDMFIMSDQHRLVVAKAFRLKWLNADQTVVVRNNKGHRREVVFPNSRAYVEHRNDMFYNALIPYTCKHNRGLK